MNIKLIRLLYIAILFCSALGFSQSRNAAGEKILIENADNQIIDNTTNPSTKYFKGNIRAYHNNAFFYCDSAKIVGNIMWAYGGVTIVQDDTLTIFSDELFYDGDSLFAYLKNKVVLQNNKDNLFTEYLEYDLKEKVAWYRDKALMVSDKNQLKSKKGRYDVAKNTVLFQERVTLDGDDFHMVTDTMHYDTKNEVAVWYTPSILNADSALIYSDRGRYESNKKYAEFEGNAQYKKEDVTAIGQKITYDGLTKIVYLIDTLTFATYSSAKDTAQAKTIVYYEESGIIDLKGKASFKNSESAAVGDAIKYNKSTKSFQLQGDGEIIEGSNRIKALYLDYDNAAKKGIAIGNVVWRDTLEGTILESDSLITDDKEGYFKAKNKQGKPLLTSIADGDTLWLSSNTILKQKSIVKRDSLTTDTITLLKGIGNVEIFKPDLQVVSDSMVFNQSDSIFTFYNKPLLWTDTTQLSGDTLLLYLKNKKVDKLIAKKNVLVVTSEDLIYFNQIGGNLLQATLKDDAIEKMRIDGNAQVIYYMTDDEKAYIGVNQTDCSYMTFFFKDKKIDNIKFYTKPESTVSPMDKVDHDKIKLKNFKWEFEKRPSSPQDLKL